MAYGHGLDEAMMRRGIPAHMYGGMKRYILHGIPPGSFLTAVLSNDLMGALGKADEDNRVALHAYGMFLYNDAPSPCHGSPEKVRAWIAKGGMAGAQATEAAED